MQYSAEHLKRVPTLLAQANAQSNQLQTKRAELCAQMSWQKLKGQLSVYDAILCAIQTAYAIADAAVSVEQTNEERTQLLQKVQEEATRIYQELLYFSQIKKTWKKQTLIEYEKKIPEYAAYFRGIRNNSRYQLPEKIERIISTKDKYASTALTNIYALLTSAHTFTFTHEGKKISVNRAELQQYLRHPQREVRKKASNSFYKTFSADVHVLHEIYTALVGDYAEEARMRGYKKPIDIRHKANEISIRAYESLKKATQKQNLFRRYVRMKQQIFGYKQLHAYDLYATIPGLPKGYTYEEAKKHLLRVCKEYACWLEQAVQEVHESNTIDVYPREHKRPGACCYNTAPGEKPILILNHQTDYESYKTLAHETGHAVHDILAGENTGIQTQPQLIIAETASTILEYMVFLDTMKRANKKEKIALLCDYIDDALASTVQQLAIVEFEEWAYEDAFATRTQRDIRWQSIQEKLFPEITPSSQQRGFGWMGISHLFEQPFYCYAYSFGLLAALSIYKQTTPEQLKELLRAGGSKEPRELLLSYGLDIEKEEFYVQGYKEIELLIDTLETLITETKLQ